MNNKFINVHNFDGKLKDIFIPSREYKNDEKKVAFVELLKLLTNQNSKKAVTTIINDLNITPKKNFQPENNIDASDILMEILHYKDNSNLIKGLDEQLSDIHTLGSCSSGRVTRLLQLWLAYCNN